MSKAVGKEVLSILLGSAVFTCVMLGNTLPAIIGYVVGYTLRSLDGDIDELVVGFELESIVGAVEKSNDGIELKSILGRDVGCIDG